jgi:hypothetical protein
MEKRELAFNSYEEIAKEIEALQRTGYKRMGAWSLGQVCAHLDFYFKGSLDGFNPMLPWIVRMLIGKPTLWWLKKKKQMKPGGMTAPQSVPAPDKDEKAAIESLLQSVKRLGQARQLHPSSFFGELTVAEWRWLHLMHAAHHLGFLIPEIALATHTG